MSRRLHWVAFSGYGAVLAWMSLSPPSDAGALFWDKALSAEMRTRQEQYLASSNEVKIADVEAWSLTRRLWNNTVGMLSPLL